MRVTEVEYFHGCPQVLKVQNHSINFTIFDKMVYIIVLLCIYIVGGMKMTAFVKQWGNSLAVRIPKDIAQTLSLDNDSMVELNIKDGKLVVEPKQALTLEDMVAKISDENIHKEVDFGKRVGNEEW
jgi:antitoxin MazE